MYNKLMPSARAYKRKPGARYIRKTEESEQQRFVTWVKRYFPHVIIYCDAMGEDLTDSGRMRVHAMRNIRVPDIIIDYPSRGYHGARFEHKKEGTKVYCRDGVTLRKQPYKHTFRTGAIKTGDHLQEQADSLVKLNKAGYYARFTIGLEELKRHFLWYIEAPEQLQLDLESPF